MCPVVCAPGNVCTRALGVRDPCPGLPHPTCGLVCASHSLVSTCPGRQADGSLRTKQLGEKLRRGNAGEGQQGSPVTGAPTWVTAASEAQPLESGAGLPDPLMQTGPPKNFGQMNLGPLWLVPSGSSSRRLAAPSSEDPQLQKQAFSNTGRRGSVEPGLRWRAHGLSRLLVRDFPPCPIPSIYSPASRA